MRSPEQLIAEYDMLPEGETVVCAVSGGADSVCLLNWLAARGIPVVAAHFNHMLRGAASDRDEAFVAGLCREWNIPLRVGRADVAAAAAARGRGIEETARALRYAFLDETARETGAGRIATAHTADDNLETVLLHLTRGCGLRGLTGIPPRRGAIVRPFLETGRAEILAWLDEHGVSYIEDESNTDERFSRNRIRAQVVPVLRGLNPNLTGSAAETVRLLRGEDALLDDLAAECDLRTGDEPLALRRIARLLREAGQTGYSAAHLRAVLALMRGASPSGTVHLPGGLTAVRSYDTLSFSRAAAPSATLEPVPVPGQGVYRFGDWKISISPGICPAENEKKPDTFWLDCDKIVGGMTLRSRRDGDRLRLPGRRMKTVKRLFIDEKLPRAERDGVPILADARGVLAAVGFGPHEGSLAAPHARAFLVTTEQIDCRRHGG